MGKSRKRAPKEKSHSSILKNMKRMDENRKVLNELKINESRYEST